MPPNRRRLRDPSSATRPVTCHPDREFRLALQAFATANRLTTSGALIELGRRAMGMPSLLARMDQADGE